MKNLIIYVLINFFINISFSQTKLTELATGPKNVEDIQTYSIGDSLFIAVNWFNANANEIFKKGYWINVQSGETSSYDLGVIQKGILSGIEK
jgi:hypothetical protein